MEQNLWTHRLRRRALPKRSAGQTQRVLGLLLLHAVTTPQACHRGYAQPGGAL
jgi:hypothetical protein